jgi:hypothetical protein
MGVVALGADGSVWELRHCGHADTTPVSRVTPRETCALQALTYGNAGLAAGECAAASAAFPRVRAMDPQPPHGAGRLAAAARRRHTAGGTPPINMPVSPAGRGLSASAVGPATLWHEEPLGR